MNEMEIAFSGSKSALDDWYVTVLKFANFNFAERKPSELNENPEDHGDSNEEIVKMKMKKIISDCVDFGEEETDLEYEPCEKDEDEEGEDEEDEEHEKYEEMRKNTKKKNMKKMKNLKK